MAQPTSPERLASYIAMPGGDPLPVTVPTGVRVNATAGDSSTAEAAVPAGGTIVMIRATAAIWIRFGATGMGAAAADANSIMFVAGEAPYQLKTGEAYFRVLRVGASDVVVQLESVGTLSPASY